MPSNQRLRNYYKILGISPSASRDEIKTAYRRLAMKFHPDINQTDDSLFWMQLYNEAYGVLGNKSKKALYDYIFFADSSFSSQNLSETSHGLSSFSAQPTGFRSSFSHFIVSVIGVEEFLNIVFLALVLIAASLYLVFGQAGLAAGMMVPLFVIAFIVLIIRCIAEIFIRAGIHQEEEWFHEAFEASGYLASEATENAKEL